LFVIKIFPLDLFTQFKLRRKREISNYTSNSARACQFAVSPIITRWVTVTRLCFRIKGSIETKVVSYSANVEEVIIIEICTENYK
jgi:hypothetical protein